MMIDRHVEENATEIGQLPEFLKKAVICLEISNVARWLYEDSSDEFENFDSFPNLAPSWPLTWAEYRVPEKVNSQGNISINRQREAFNYIGIYRDAVFIKEKNEFISILLLFTENKKGILMPVSRTVMHIDRNGKILNIAATSIEKSRNYLCNNGPYQDVYAANKELVKFGDIVGKTFYFANSLLHCKNIKLIEPGFDHKKINQKRQKQGKLPLFRSKTLEINPMREVLRVEGKSHEIGLKRSLHICRAHFATYTKEAPLFGKIVGTFFKPMHVKGSVNKGIVIKDYTIKPPSN